VGADKPLGGDDGLRSSAQLKDMAIAAKQICPILGYRPAPERLSWIPPKDHIKISQRESQFQSVHNAMTA
jgi:hypothetical protein